MLLLELQLRNSLQAVGFGNFRVHLLCFPSLLPVDQCLKLLFCMFCLVISLCREEVKSGHWLFHYGPEQMLVNYVSKLNLCSRLSVYAPISGGERFLSFSFFQNFGGLQVPLPFLWIA